MYLLKDIEESSGKGLRKEERKKVMDLQVLRKQPNFKKAELELIIKVNLEKKERTSTGQFKFMSLIISNS